MDFDTAALCSERLERYVYLIHGEVPDSDIIKDEIKDRCIRRVDPGVTPLPKDLSALGLAAQKDWEDYSARTILAKYFIEQLIENADTDGIFTEEEAILVIEFTDDMIAQLKKIRDTFEQYKGSIYFEAATLAIYVYSDYDLFIIYASDIKARFSNYLKTLDAVCPNGYVDRINNLCICDEGYYWNEVQDQCTYLSVKCKDDFGQNAEGDKKTGECICKAGYEFNERNNCVSKDKSTAKAAKSIDTTTLNRDECTGQQITGDNFRYDVNAVTRCCYEGYRLKSSGMSASGVIYTCVEIETKFSDISSSHKHAEAINFVKANGFVDGYADGTYKADNKINRAEFTKILTIAAFTEAESYPGSNCFGDIKGSDWFSKYVCFAKSREIIGGYPDRTFKPANNINAAEALKITLEALYDVIPDISGAWYQKYWDFAMNNTLLPTEWAKPDQQITRGEMAQLIFNIKSK